MFVLQSGNQKANNVLSCIRKNLVRDPYLDHNGQKKGVSQLIQSRPGVHLIPEVVSIQSILSLCLSVMAGRTWQTSWWWQHVVEDSHIINEAKWPELGTRLKSSKPHLQVAASSFLLRLHIPLPGTNSYGTYIPPKRGSTEILQIQNAALLKRFDKVLQPGPRQNVTDKTQICVLSFG